jgi:hypothetical protein
MDDDGRQLWPTMPPDAEFWYVVREEDAVERTVILRQIARHRKKSEDGCLIVALTFFGFAVLAVVDVVARMVRAVLRR